MQSTKQIASEIIAREGGYVNDPDDPGGATNFGVNSVGPSLGAPSRDLDGCAGPDGLDRASDLQFASNCFGNFIAQHGRGLSVCQTLHVVAAGLSGSCVQLGRLAGLDR